MEPDLEIPTPGFVCRFSNLGPRCWVWQCLVGRFWTWAVLPKLTEGFEGTLRVTSKFVGLIGHWAKRCLTGSRQVDRFAIKQVQSSGGSEEGPFGQRLKDTLDKQGCTAKSIIYGGWFGTRCGLISFPGL